jgi:hypothetical protein
LNENITEQVSCIPKDTPNASKKMTLGYLDVIVIALFTALLTIVGYDRFFVGKVVVVDLSGFVKEQRELYAQGKIGEAEITARLAQVQKFVKGQPKNLTVINKDVVLANGREIPVNLPPEKPGEK